MHGTLIISSSSYLPSSMPRAISIMCTSRAAHHAACPLNAGLIQPELLADGQVCVDMGEPVLDGPKVCLGSRVYVCVWAQDRSTDSALSIHPTF